MSPTGLSALKSAALAVAATLLLGGCVYDYTQGTDRVAYSTGDAVKANLERETMNPTSDAMYSTGGLGRDGRVVDPEATPD